MIVSSVGRKKSFDPSITGARFLMRFRTTTSNQQSFCGPGQIHSKWTFRVLISLFISTNSSTNFFFCYLKLTAQTRGHQRDNDDLMPPPPCLTPPFNATRPVVGQMEQVVLLGPAPKVGPVITILGTPPMKANYPERTQKAKAVNLILIPYNFLSSRWRRGDQHVRFSINPPRYQKQIGGVLWNALKSARGQAKCKKKINSFEG